MYIYRDKLPDTLICRKHTGFFSQCLLHVCSQCFVKYFFHSVCCMFVHSVCCMYVHSLLLSIFFTVFVACLFTVFCCMFVYRMKSFRMKRRLKSVIEHFYPQVNARIIFQSSNSIKNFFKFKDRVPLSLCCLSVYFQTVFCHLYR